MTGRLLTVGATRAIDSRYHVLTAGARTLCGIDRARIRYRRTMDARVFAATGYRCETCAKVLARHADTAEPVTPQAVVTRTDSDGDDTHTVGHD